LGALDFDACPTVHTSANNQTTSKETDLMIWAPWYVWSEGDPGFRRWGCQTGRQRLFKHGSSQQDTLFRERHSHDLASRAVAWRPLYERTRQRNATCRCIGDPDQPDRASRLVDPRLPRITFSITPRSNLCLNHGSRWVPLDSWFGGSRRRFCL